MLDFLNREPKLSLTTRELELRVESLMLELARANKRIDALERRLDGKQPTLDEADSARKIMACIGRANGATGDTAHLGVRQALLKHANFAQLRDALARKGEPSIVQNEPRLRWLAERSKLSGETRFALIHRGAYTVRQLAEAER